jgi:hypothetical protein
VPHPAENYQLRFLGLAAARAFGRAAATVQIAAIREDGSIDVREANLGTDELDEIATELAYIARRVQTSREGDPVYKTGSHCRYCPALPYCPAIAGAGQAILEGPPEELTPKRAVQMWAQLQAVEAAAKKTREALQEFVYARPIPIEAGKQLKVVETRRENIDSGKAFPILREHLPDEMAAFREAGAISETYSESLREVRSDGAYR